MLPLSVRGSIPAPWVRTACCPRSPGFARRSFGEFREPEHIRRRSRSQVRSIPGSARSRAGFRGARRPRRPSHCPPFHPSNFFSTPRVHRSGPILTARGKSHHGIRPSLHPGGRRWDSGGRPQGSPLQAPESRLVRRAQEQSRCSRDFHHGLAGTSSRSLRTRSW